MNVRFILLFAGMLLLASHGVNAQTSKNLEFSREALTVRLGKIMKMYRVDITFEDAMMRGISVSSLNVETKSTAETILSQSLSATEFSYKKLTDKSFVISKDNTNTKKGAISGTVMDKDGFPIPGATVLVVGTSNGTATDVKGRFMLRDVPARTLSVEVRCISYTTMRISDINLRPGQSKPLDVVLQDATQELTEVVVTATYNKASANGLYARQKAMIVMSDGVSADLIKKTADNNVAQVLKRVSGVTVENGKYVTVRGLSERYNNVQLNGSSLPSTEPNRRNFSFDIIPTALIDNVTISKTFTPDLPGEFTGGLVEVNTLSIPDKPLISVSIGTGFNTISTGKDFRSNKRFGSDYLFGNTRDWYGKDWKTEISSGMFPNMESYSALTPEQQKTLNVMDARVPNYWGMHNFKGAPTQNYAVTVGMPFDLGNENKLGVIASLSYRHEENTDDLQRAVYIGSEVDTLITGKQYKFVTATGAVVNVGWERLGHKITWRNLFNNRFTHTNIERSISKGSDIYQYQMEQYSSPQINRLWQTQLSGEHRLPLDMTFSWMADYSKIMRSTPDDRLAVGALMSSANPGSLTDPAPDENGNYTINWMYPYYNNMGSGFQMYSRLDENKKNIGGNLEYPFVVQGNKQKLKVGYLGTFRKADFKREYLQTRKTSDESRLPYEEGAPLNEVYSPQLYAEGKLFLRKSGIFHDYYKGDQYLHAAYLMGDFTFWKRLHLTAGVRMEAGKMKATSQYRDNKRQLDVDTMLVNKKTDWLPAVTAIYNFTDNFNLRAAYSKTLARPDFRELTISSYFNVEDRIIVNNRVGVKQAYTDNVDLRLEWYPQSGEVISLSGFYKRFKDPVELLSLQSQQDMHYERYTFNLKRATALGMELNLRKSFGFLAPGSFLKDFYLTANATILKGDVKYNIWELIFAAAGLDMPKDADFPEDRKRPLQGLVPYAVNAGLDYSGKIFGAVLNYGATGRKLMQAGTYEMYDEYEAPRHVLDLQLSARFLNGRMEVKANASDLLNQAYVVYRNLAPVSGEDLTDDMGYNKGKDQVLSQYKRGTTYSFSVSYKF